jgi:hypothetical protein
MGVTTPIAVMFAGQGFGEPQSEQKVAMATLVWMLMYQPSVAVSLLHAGRGTHRFKVAASAPFAASITRTRRVLGRQCPY